MTCNAAASAGGRRGRGLGEHAGKPLGTTKRSVNVRIFPEYEWIYLYCEWICSQYYISLASNLWCCPLSFLTQVFVWLSSLQVTTSFSDCRVGVAGAWGAWGCPGVAAPLSSSSRPSQVKPSQKPWYKKMNLSSALIWNTRLVPNVTLARYVVDKFRRAY